MLKELKYNDLLGKAAIDHYIDIASKGLTSHISSDGKTNYKQRIERHAVWGGSIFEAILYGQEKPSPKDVLLALVIDDGFASRIHRKNIFNSDHSQVAVVAGAHSSAGFCYIALFAS